MIEITRLRLRPDVAEDAFLAADARMQSDFAYQQPGLLRRTTARGDDGGWVVIELWRGQADADAAADRRRTDLTARAFDALVDDASLDVIRYRELDA